ncbi:MAG: UDP-N-acetylmuramate--L-alanine ligase [Verrucomicrobiae bacterium]|nr:UDP-N-acetylmuramate--L-alanine ligase [Verrucomicrobiae bacterium]
MSGLAHLLAQRGHRVTGSDIGEEFDAEALRRAGIVRYRGHSAAHVENPDFVCYSSAIPTDNDELVEAQRRGIPLVRRARALAALVPPQKAMLVGGTHGKTTTTSMIAHTLVHAGVDPSFYVGAFVPDLGGSARHGKGENFVIEADESDGTMSEFAPHDLVLLNVEAEHLDFYADLAAIERAFRALVSCATGRVIYCADDPVAARVAAAARDASAWSAAPSLAAGAEWIAVDVRLEASGSRFTLRRGAETLGEVCLRVPGRHNVSNAVGAIAAAMGAGVSFAKAAEALTSFSGARRRFERVFESARFRLVDDYAHHPSEVRATLRAARQVRHGRLLAVFQPHRYSRTRALHEEFGAALHEADRVFITEVYAASETPIEGVSGELVARALAAQPGRDPASVTWEPNMWRLKDRLAAELRDGDTVLAMGAGNIQDMTRRLASELRAHNELAQLLDPGADVRLCEPMAKRTSMRVGGPARLWIEPAGERDLVAVLRRCSEARQSAGDAPEVRRLYAVTVVGRGSNLLVRDAGISGVTLHLGREAFRGVEARRERLRAGGGARLKQVVAAARAAGLEGLEFLEGIPGSVGGALRMNAGAMGSSVFEVVERVRFVTLHGEIVERAPEELHPVYRHCPGLDGCLVLWAEFRGTPAPVAKIDARLKAFEEKRRASQPAAACAGCIFKNPPGDSAGRLIDACGLKGLAFGAARVSEAHANFIVNDGGATASDILTLAGMVRDRVRAARGIELEMEVVVLGDEGW